MARKKYNDYFVNQLTELLTQYGRVDEVWFDGACGEGPNGKKQEYDFMRYYTEIRRLQPQAVIAVMGPDVRWVGTESGYGRDTEWSVLPAAVSSLNAIAESSQQEAGSGTFLPEGDKMAQDLGKPFFTDGCEGSDLVSFGSRCLHPPGLVLPYLGRFFGENASEVDRHLL